MMLFFFLYVKTLLNLFSMRTTILNNLVGSLYRFNITDCVMANPSEYIRERAAATKDHKSLSFCTLESPVLPWLQCVCYWHFHNQQRSSQAFAVSAHPVTHLTRSGLQTALMISISSAAPCTCALWPGTLWQPRWWSWFVTVSGAETRRRAQPGGVDD